MKSYLNALKTRLSGVTTLRHIDCQWGQLAYDQPPVKYPCALIEIASSDIRAVKPDALHVGAAVTISIADLRFNRNQAGAFDVFDTVEAVASRLQGWTDGRFGRLSLTEIRPNGDIQPGFVVYQLTFSTSFGLEPSAEPEPTTTEPTTTEPGEPTTTEPGGEPTEPTEPSAEPTTTEPDFEDGPVF